MVNKKTCIYLKKIITLIIIIIMSSILRNIKTKKIRIMPLGDSITDGGKTKGAYRKYLYNSLTKSGYSIKMVGPLLSNEFFNFKNENENFSYDASHCGYSSFTIKTNEERKGIMNMVQDNKYLIKYKPDIIILMIGTNDVMINEDVETIIKHLKDFLLYIKNNIKKSSLLLVTSIPPLNPNTERAYEWFKNYREDKGKKKTDIEVRELVGKKVEDYNKGIKELINDLRNYWINIYFSDLSSVLTNIDEFFYDGVHPNEKGHKLMGDYLYKQLGLILKKFKKVL